MNMCPTLFRGAGTRAEDMSEGANDSIATPASILVLLGGDSAPWANDVGQTKNAPPHASKRDTA